MPLSFNLICCFQHILNKNSITPCRIIDKDMGNGTNQLTVLNNRTAAHARVNIGPTDFLYYLFSKIPPKAKESHRSGAIPL